MRGEAGRSGDDVRSDLHVVVEPAEGRDLTVASRVEAMYGDAIRTTVTGTLDALGVTDLTLSDDNPVDLSEGFALDPPPTGAFADVVYAPGSITVIPEPASVALVLIGGVVFGLRRRR